MKVSESDEDVPLGRTRQSGKCVASNTWGWHKSNDIAALSRLQNGTSP
jgi:hypothetical protein